MAGKQTGNSASLPVRNPRAPFTIPARRVLQQLAIPSLTLAHVEYAPGCCFSRHSEARPFLAATVHGVHWSSNNHGGYTCVPGSVRFLPAGEPHENYFPARSRCVLVKLLPPIVARAGEYAALPERPMQLAMPSAALLSRLLLAELYQQDDLSPLAAEELALEFLLAGVQEPRCSATPIAPWLHRVHEMLQEESGRRFTLTELARCAGRHPVQVCRQFHRRFSCTIGEYVRRFRVARAQSLLVSSDLSLVQIAFTCGFADQSQLTTMFRRLVGVAPGRYRKQFPGRDGSKRS